MAKENQSTNNFVLSFDLPRECNAARVRIFRRLRTAGARLFHHSLWTHANVKALTDIAIEIKESGGRAVILEERLVF